MTDRIALSIEEGVAEVRLIRADKLNALDPAMFEALVSAIDQLAARNDVRVVVLSGDGRAFCAGLDLASMASGGSGIDLHDVAYGHANLVQQVSWGWRTLPMPVIAAVHGVAFGGGFQIMSGACIRIAHPDTRFAIMEAKWGIVPDMAGFALWRGVARDDVVRELAYTAREFDAREAQAFGFVTRLADDPLGDAMTLAREIAGRNPHAMRAIKRLADVALQADAPAILAAEREEQSALLRSPNQMEAVRAGMEKRPPRFVD
jgi:enoyl-CoA hydratase/carnithine racemase